MIPDRLALETSIEHGSWIRGGRGQLSCLEDWLCLSKSIHISSPSELILGVTGGIHGTIALQRVVELLHGELTRHIAHAKLVWNVTSGLHHTSVQDEV